MQLPALQTTVLAASVLFLTATAPAQQTVAQGPDLSFPTVLYGAAYYNE
jgi:hypothetical protein